MSDSSRLRLAPDIHAVASPVGSWYVMPTPVDGVVSVRGSIETAPDFSAGEQIVQDLMVSMLDKGTKSMDKRILAEYLEDRGASTKFSSEGIRIRFSARCLSADLSDVLPVLFDQFTDPLFDAEEFERVRNRIQSNVSRRLTHTGSRARSMLRRRLYPDSHPNYEPPVEDDLKALASVSIDDLIAFHERMIAANNLNVVVVGDVDETLTPAGVRHLNAGWTDRPEEWLRHEAIMEPGMQHLHIPDRPNLDVRFGQFIDVRRGDDDYLPLYAGIFALGGNFSSRLMTVVRDEMGLTYGIRSALSSVDRYFAGHWGTSVTLSADRLEEGISATRDVIERYLADGISEDELEGVKTTLVGSHEVQLETTGGIAGTILGNLERGWGVERVDTLADMIEDLDADRVNAAMQRHLKPAELHICSAGTRQDIE